MRDDHFKNGHSHAADPGSSSTTLPQKIEDEELQPLIFDLIETNQVEIIKPLMPRLRSLDRFVQMKIALHAAKMCSHSIIELFNDSGLLTGAFFTKFGLDWNRFSDLAKLIVQSESVGLSKILLYWVSTLNTQKGTIYEVECTVKAILISIIALESEDIFELWRPILVTGFNFTATNWHVGPVFADVDIIAATNNSPNGERMLVRLWRECEPLDTLSVYKLESFLRTIAENTCSVNLARYAIQHGCEVDSTAHKASPTALQVAARKTTQQAADLMEFLLLQGADPNVRSRNKGISDEKGAREISKWLGMSWEQLVTRTTEERQKQEKRRRGFLL